jgi:protein-tyrosine phosphatase
VDDGAQDAAQSVAMLEQLEREGAKAIICTPHYIMDSGSAYTREQNKALFDILKRCTKLKLYLGNEIYIDENIERLLERKIISPLADSEYILVELPMSGRFADYEDILLDLSRNYKVILAHPERYKSFQKDFSKIENLVNEGILLQCNFGTLQGQYGKEAMRTLKQILKKRYAFCFGTDIHHERDFCYFQQAIIRLWKIVKDDKYFRDIIYYNAEKIISKQHKHTQ